MIKKLLILTLSMFLIACDGDFKDDNTKENKTNMAYPFDQMTGFEEDKSLYLKSTAPLFYSNINTESDSAYDKDELANLDYNQDLLFYNMYIRIPQRCKVFRSKSSDKYIIDFPYSSSYNIFLSFEEVTNPKILDQEDILDAAKLSEKTVDSGESIISHSLRNKMTNVDSAYFISEKSDQRLTHFFVKTPSAIIHFTITEDKNLSAKAKDIMSDILIAMYKESDDPMELGKNFTDYTDKINVFASKEVEMGKIKFKIPENFLLSQDKNGIKAYISKIDGEVVSEIIIKTDDKNGRKLEDIASLNSGDIIYPINIVTNGPSDKGEINKVSYIRNGARLYSSSFSLKGDKVVMETKDEFVTFFILGPLNDNDQTSIMTKSIISSIEKKK
ncbi:MAG: hypothetical protein E6704_00560 [Anaerococcus prevotii]|nr:hypothetical protein [Anaerococcus prevotii]